MLSGITFFTEDKIWSGILSDFGAAAADKEIADVIFRTGNKPVSPIELKSKIIKTIETERRRALKKVGATTDMSENSKKIITLLVRAGKHGLSAESLKIAIGYAPDANSHALDTSIYNLRKSFGTDFIKTDKGKYFIVISNQ
ncbi:MAG: hypothetical protein FWC83_02370 [Alphaproteobacteria bacterium]|nr:hypothetical protein [Alphaproteobacteria bacterium]